jgi:mRNA interferase MazF
LHNNFRTVIIAPMTTKGHAFPTRVPCQFRGKRGHVVLDQLQAVDHGRLIKKLGKLDPTATALVLNGLQALFSP